MPHDTPQYFSNIRESALLAPESPPAFLSRGGLQKANKIVVFNAPLRFSGVIGFSPEMAGPLVQISGPASFCPSAISDKFLTIFLN